MKKSHLTEQIFLTISHIPEGKFTTYGRIAELVPGATARLVARTLTNLPEDTKLPWHRVISATLKPAIFHHTDLQLELLRNEGVLTDSNGKLNPQKIWP